MIDDRAKHSFDEQGYFVARGLFDSDEAGRSRDHFMQLREAGAYAGDVVGVDPSSDDPLKKYPRMIHMHRWDEVALAWLLEPRLAQALSTLLDGLEPFAVQTMLYFKPPGARGQAPHPGDVVFFNGSLVHGSKPKSSTRFRRALIGHYIHGDAREVAHWYHPVLRMDGSEVELELSLGGGACGEWVERDGATVIELTGIALDPRTTE